MKLQPNHTRRVALCRLVMLATLVLALTAPCAAWAFNDLGHMVVAQIAEDRLDAKTKAAVDQLLAVPVESQDALAHTNTFITAACWADDTKKITNTSEWHYINFGFSLDGTTPRIKPQAMDVIKAINQARATLADPLTSQTAKAEMLRYLIHFVGDIHQPLHCTAYCTAAHPEGDRGGNDFPITGFDDARNLHFLWDDGAGRFLDPVGRPLTEAGQQKVRDLAHRITTDYPPSIIAGKSMATRAWAEESFAVAKQVTYSGIKEGEVPSPEYLARSQKTVDEQVAKAGYRLAALLEGIFNPPTGKSTP